MHLSVRVVVRPGHSAIPYPVPITAECGAVFEAHERKPTIVWGIALHLYAHLRPPAAASSLRERNRACEADKDRDEDDQAAAVPIHRFASAALISWLLRASAVSSFSSSAA